MVFSAADYLDGMMDDGLMEALGRALGNVGMTIGDFVDVTDASAAMLSMLEATHDDVGREALASLYEMDRDSALLAVSAALESLVEGDAIGPEVDPTLSFSMAVGTLEALIWMASAESGASQPPALWGSAVMVASLTAARAALSDCGVPWVPSATASTEQDVAYAVRALTSVDLVIPDGASEMLADVPHEIVCASLGCYVPDSWGAFLGRPGVPFPEDSPLDLAVVSGIAHALTSLASSDVQGLDSGECFFLSLASAGLGSACYALDDMSPGL